jgi:hypothetical protein
MKNREVSIGVCGAIVGMLVGAGSVAYSQEITASLEGNFLQGALLGYRNSALDDARQRRSVRDAERMIHSAAAPEETVVEKLPEKTQEQKKECYNKVRTAEELREIILPLLPSRPIDELIRHTMNQAFDAYVSKCQLSYKEVLRTKEKPEVVPVEVPQEKHVPNYDHCEGFSGVRLTRCIDDERKGNPWYRGGAVR